MSGWAAAAQALSELVSSATPSLINYFATKDLQSQQWDRTKKMWQMTNDYNSPKNVVARLKDAGLNPNLATGQITGGLATQSVAPSGTYNVSAQGESYFSRRAAAEQVKNLRKEGQLLDDQSEYVKEQTELIRNQVPFVQEQAENYAQNNRLLRHDADIITGTSSLSSTPQSEVDFKRNYPRLYRWQPLIRTGTQVASTAAQTVGIGGALYKLGKIGRSGGQQLLIKPWR